MLSTSGMPAALPATTQPNCFPLPTARQARMEAEAALATAADLQASWV